MNLKDMINFFKKYFNKEKSLFLKAFLFVLVGSILGISYGYIIGLGIDEASNGAFGLAITLFIIYFLLSFIDYIIFNRLGRIYLNRVSNNIMEQIGYETFYKVGLLPARAFEEKSSGELINRVIDDSGKIADTFTRLLRVIIALFTSVVIFIYICFNSKLIALEIVIYIVVFFIISKKYLPIIKDKYKDIKKDKDRAVAEVNESIRGIREIRALGIRKTVNENIKNTIRNIYFNTNKVMIEEKNYNAWVDVLCAFFECTVFITCVILVMLKKVSFAFFMSLTYYIYRFMNTVNLMMELSTSYQEMKVAMQRLDEILGNKLYRDISFGTVEKTNIIGNIEFKNVTFRYKENEDYIFKNFNISIPSGKKVAIVGRSGQGKTSIFNLLLRYFDVESGVVLIDDIPIEDFSESSFNKNISIIRQDPFIFNKSIVENFKIIDPYISLKTIRKFCKIACIDEYIMSLPKKYDTVIGEGGINLSGGQKQRLAIARSLLKESKIILFDEATSALDNENQTNIKKAIDNLVLDHTIVIVAHRLSTIVDADIIFLIDNGEVVASGTHKELLKKNKIYKSLYENEES